MVKRANITVEEIKLAEDIVNDIFKKTDNYTVLQEVALIFRTKGITPNMPIYEDKDANGNGFFGVGLM